MALIAFIHNNLPFDSSNSEPIIIYIAKGINATVDFCTTMIFFCLLFRILPKSKMEEILHDQIEQYFLFPKSDP